MPGQAFLEAIQEIARTLPMPAAPISRRLPLEAHGFRSQDGSEAEAAGIRNRPLRAIRHLRSPRPMEEIRNTEIFRTFRQKRTPTTTFAPTDLARAVSVEPALLLRAGRHSLR